MGLTVCEKGSLDAVWLLVWVWGERGVRWDGGTLGTLQGEALLILSGIQKDRPRAVGNLRPELRDPFQSPLWTSLRVTPYPSVRGERRPQHLPSNSSTAYQQTLHLPVLTSPSTCPKVSENNHRQQQ